MNYSPRDFTRDKMKKMGHSGGAAIGAPPGNIDRSKDADGDDYGHTAAKSDSSDFKKGGGVHAKGKRPHMGRAGRATGGRVGRATGGKTGSDGVEGKINTQMKDDGGMIAQGDLPETHFGSDGKDRQQRARGGKTKSGKTVVNIVVGAGGKDQQPPPQMAPPMAPPMPPPQPPQKPPMPPPQGQPIMMPPGGAPMGPGGAPPPGAGPPPAMHARGGRVGNLGKFAHAAKAGFSDSKAPHRGGGKEGFSDTKPTSKRPPMADGHKDFGKSGVKKGRPMETAGNNGEGRLEKARRQA